MLHTPSVFEIAILLAILSVPVGVVVLLVWLIFWAKRK